MTRKYDDSIDGREITLRLIYSQLRRAKEILGDSRNPLGILIERCGLSLPSVYSTLPNQAKIDYAQNQSQSHLQVHDWTTDYCESTDWRCEREVRWKLERSLRTEWTIDRADFPWLNELPLASPTIAAWTPAQECSGESRVYRYVIAVYSCYTTATYFNQRLQWQQRTQGKMTTVCSSRRLHRTTRVHQSRSVCRLEHIPTIFKYFEVWKFCA